MEAQRARKQTVIKMYSDTVTKIGCFNVFCGTVSSFIQITVLKTVWQPGKGHRFITAATQENERGLQIQGCLARLVRKLVRFVSKQKCRKKARAIAHQENICQAHRQGSDLCPQYSKETEDTRALVT